MITGTLRNLTRLRIALLIAVVMFAGNSHFVCGQDDSQRPLPFPAKEAAEPGVHLELLKRLRSTITQAQQDSSPADTLAPGDPPVTPGQRNSDSQSGGPPGQQPTNQEATPPSASALQQLGDLLKNLKDQLPKGMIPPSLDELPPEEMKKGLQSPETQRKLRDLLQQFRKDGMLPPEADQGTPSNPLPGPPPAANKAVPRGSLKALDEFLQKLQQQAANSETESVQPAGEPRQRMPGDAVPQARSGPRQPLRRRDSGTEPRIPAPPQTQPAPLRPDMSSTPDSPDVQDFNENSVPPTTGPSTVNPPVVKPQASTAPRSQAGPLPPQPPGRLQAPQNRPENPGPPETPPGSTQPGSSIENETEPSDSQQSEPNAERPSTSPPAAPEAGLLSEPRARGQSAPGDSSSEPTGNPQGVPPDSRRNPLRFRPQPGRSPSASGAVPSDDSFARNADSQPDNPTPPAPRSAMDSLQQLMREMSQQLSGNTSREDKGTAEEATRPEEIAATPRSKQSPGSAPAPSQQKAPQTRPQNSDASRNAAGQARGNGLAQKNNSEVPPTVAGPRAGMQGSPRESASSADPSVPRQQPGSSTPSPETAGPSFSVEQFLNEQLQDPALRSAAASPEARRLLEQIMGQSRTAPDAGTAENSERALAQRSDGPPDPSSSPRSNHLLPRPQDARAGTSETPSTDPRNAQRGRNNDNNGSDVNENDANGQRRPSEDVGRQLQKQGFAGTLRQIVEEARRETEAQRQRQEEEALARSQSESAPEAESAPGAADSTTPGTPAAPPGPASSAWNGPDRTGDRPTFDPKAALEMLDRFSENMEKQSQANRLNSAPELSQDGGAVPEVPGPRQQNALDRMRDFAGDLLSDRPTPVAPAAVSGDSAAVTLSGASTSFDWTPAFILGGVLAALMLLIPVVRRLQSRGGVNPEFGTTEIALATHDIRTRQDIVRAFHQLAKRCSRSVRPWWNHLQVATELRRVIPDRQQTVLELSAVYERARYQPQDHELTPAELAAVQMAIRNCAATIG